MLSAVREQPVDDHADDGEEEDNQTPEEFVRRGAVGLEDLDWWGRLVSLQPTLAQNGLPG